MFLKVGEIVTAFECEEVVFDAGSLENDTETVNYVVSQKRDEEFEFSVGE